MNRMILPLCAVLFTACAPAAETAEPLELRAWTSDEAGFHTTSYWVDTGEEVVVFDAQFTPAIAEELIDSITAQTDSPIRYLVITHPNPDKFNGAPAFQAIGAEVVASEATVAHMPEVHAYKQAYFVGAGVFAPGAYPSLPQIDRSFDEVLELELAGRGSVTLETLAHGGVTTTQTVAIVDERDLVVGDLVAGQTHAWLEGGIVDGAPSPDLDSWAAALDELEGLVGPRGRVFPGRGEVAPVADAVAAQRAYLEALEAIVLEVLAEYEDPSAALADPERSAALYAEITARAEARFPDHAHGYLVSYGVYGLAWSLAGLL